MRMEVIQGDITRLDVDAIVNAANQSLLGGGGVDRAIHRAAGRQLLEACRQIPEVRPNVRCPTGEARATPGFELPARLVIHTVGPRWRDGRHGEPEKLASCYRESLQLARTESAEAIAFPAISCGVYGYPPEEAAALAMRTVADDIAAHEQPQRVIFCCFDEPMRAIFQHALDAIDG
jgi:O-acetyl-ADP-ribose deacetylase (regulator of RNase III)